MGEIKSPCPPPVDKKRTANNNIKKIHNKNINNNSLFLYEDELSHCDKNILKALSVKQILPWTKGNAIYWDEKLLHCSNNFTDKTEEKHALSLFTNLGTLK